MEHARKMALVDPRLLDSLRAPAPTDTLGRKVQVLDDEMKVILDRQDLADGDKVVMYNQVLQRYNTLADRRAREPVRVMTVNKDTSPVVTAAAVANTDPTPPEAEATGMEAAVAVGMEADVVDSVPKALRGKARRLMERLKRDVAWNARGELMHKGVAVPGSNVVDLVNDLLRQRKTVGTPTGWQVFARQLGAMNLPMELVGNEVRRLAIQQEQRKSAVAAAATRSLSRARRTLQWTPLARGRPRMSPSTLPTPPSSGSKTWERLA